MLVIDEDEWSSSKLGLVDMLVNHGVGVERLHFFVAVGALRYLRCVGHGDGSSPPWRGFPIKRSSFMRYGEITAAPASRRLGRAGLEAPPRSGPLR